MACFFFIIETLEKKLNKTRGNHSNEMKPFYLGPLKMKLRETFLYGSTKILLYGPTKMKLSHLFILGPLKNETERNIFVCGTT